MTTYLSAGMLLCYALLLTFMSLNPWILPRPGLAAWGISWDLIEHAAAYCLLTILLLTASKWSRNRLSSILITIATAAVFGVLLEFAQLWFTSNRTFSWLDAKANVVGGVIGSLAFFLIAWFFARGKKA